MFGPRSRHADYEKFEQSFFEAQERPVILEGFRTSSV